MPLISPTAAQPFAHSSCTFLPPIHPPPSRAFRHTQYQRVKGNVRSGMRGEDGDEEGVGRGERVDSLN